MMIPLILEFSPDAAQPSLAVRSSSSPNIYECCESSLCYYILKFKLPALIRDRWIDRDWVELS